MGKTMALWLGLGVLVLGAGAGCSKKDEGGGGDINATCETLSKNAADKGKFVDACIKMDPELVACVAKAKKGKGSKGDSCDKLHDRVRDEPGNPWMALMLSKAGQ